MKKLPAFLSVDWQRFLPLLNKQKNHDSIEIDKKYFLPSTIVISNGEIVFCSAKAKVSKKCFDFQGGDNDFLSENKAFRDVHICIEAVSGEEKIKVIQFAGGGHYQLTQYVSNQNIFNIEEQIFADKNSQLNFNTQVIVGSGANLTYTSIQQANDIVFCAEATIEKDAQLSVATIELNSGKTLETIDAKLMGENAFANICQMIFGNKDTETASLVTVEHKNKNTKSMINNLAILSDNAYVNIDGVNHIEKSNAGSEASQKTRMICLDENATAVANPLLLIDEYNVKASHSASVGMLDEEQIYYLQTRGLTRLEAMKILVEASIESFFEKNNITQQVKNVMEQKFEKKFEKF